MKTMRAAIVLACAISCLSGVAAAASAAVEQSHGAASAAKGDSRHEADKSLFQQPISVSIVRSAEDERRLEESDHEELAKKSNDKLVAYSTVALAVVTLFLAIWTGLLWKATVQLGRDAKETSERQSQEMQKSIAEATRAASAMEDVAAAAGVSARASTESVTTLKEVTAKQMRAYLSVVMNGGVFQERDKGYYFGINPILVNSGNTPAHSIRYWAKAGVYDFPLPDGFDFPDGEDSVVTSFALGPHQTVVLNARLPDFVDDGEAQEIKDGKNKRIHIWGKVSYVDVFGQERFTQFSHNVYWFGPAGAERWGGTYCSPFSEST
ncbi:hypothetical protein GNZ12_24265 [Paraburkholderia sp. 1N]|uniref:Uncharacterized protein n=1 Tax=Paraburkholderia solitsugae TaxID=2675748 RepID=A0ABX2BUR3_9BURK|nr:hypothetical protein [Paraburkholderia solitsugae]NPT44369.1 hypothetical protein [Paraburkholderia solitsugae]